MERKALGWTVAGVGLALLATVGFLDLSSWLRVALLLLVAAVLAYGLWLVFTKAKPSQVEVHGELVAAGQWRSNKWTGFQVEVTVTLAWNNPIQMLFTLELPDGTRIDNDEYHRAYVAGEAPRGFMDNPKKFDPGQTGPFKIAFIIPAVDDPRNIPKSGYWLAYTSVLPGLADGRIPLSLMTC